MHMRRLTGVLPSWAATAGCSLALSQRCSGTQPFTRGPSQGQPNTLPSRRSASTRTHNHSHQQQYTNNTNRRHRGSADSASDAGRISSHAAPVSVPPCAARPLQQLLDMHGRESYAAIGDFADAHWDPDTTSLLAFSGCPCDARDVLVVLIRVYVAVGRMDKVRRVFAAGLRDLAEGAEGGDGRRPSLLNASVLNAYLEALTRRKNYDRDEVVFALEAVRAHGVAPDALTYHYLIELHIRAGYDPQPLWAELTQERRLRPLPATTQAVLQRVVPHTHDAAFAVDVVREALKGGSATMDKRTLAELVSRWLRARTSTTPTTTTAGPATTSGADAPAGGCVGPAAGSPYPPEQVMWLMLNLEARCILDKASFVQLVQKQHVAELLLRCAKGADATTTAEALALMDRHAMSKTADVLSLVVWAWAQAGELEKAFDMVELMARKGHLELTDAMKKYHVECLRYTMERHFLMILADAVASPAPYQRALAHLNDRRRRGLAVTVHALDVLVLAAGKMGEERRALQLALSYPSMWGVQPRTATLNALLVGCTAQGRSVLLDTIYEAMLRAGVQPNALTFRLLIRQSVHNDCVDDAVRFLTEVTRHPGLRVEVEMILPIMERAARVGDVETVNRVSKFSLDCDIGVDGAVLQNVMQRLAEAGQSVEVLKGHQPLHEALRSRSKTGRHRARSELVL